jgi:hypothetical protein
MPRIVSLAGSLKGYGSTGLIGKRPVAKPDERILRATSSQRRREVNSRAPLDTIFLRRHARI